MFQRITESLLTEATRQQLITKSKNADNYKDTSKGKNRWERRLRSKVANQVRSFNDINMDKFFKQDILEIGILVFGETDNYKVTIRFDNVLRETRREVEKNKGVLKKKDILSALLTAFKNGDVYVSCTCPDFSYSGFYYYANKGNYSSVNIGGPAMRAPVIRNPKDSKGAGCKHILLVLSNLNWIIKVASVVVNYIKYCQQYMERNYADYIYPKIFGKKYNKEVQLTLFDRDTLDTDRSTLDTVNTRSYKGRDEKGRFTRDNPFKFNKTKEQQNDEDPNQLHFKIPNNKEKQLKLR